ncbi:MAG: restriction endonuclease [Kiritimatiellae bacterium]|nr:restriction endonuclease [Kiritimatiellia bacterium]
MTAKTFQKLLSEEVQSYKSLLETGDGDWIVKGFIDVKKNIYTITNDTKVISKLIELLLIPRLAEFARQNGLVLELPSAQNFYPDLTFRDAKGNLFAVDFKSSYYGSDGKVNALSLGSYWGYFRNRDVVKNTDHPYGAYRSHLVLGILYRQKTVDSREKNVYPIRELQAIRSVIGQFLFFLQPKWKIASDRPGSGNTRNIGGVLEIDRLVQGTGPFADLGEEVFDDYWMNFFNSADARNAGIGKPRYQSLETYRNYLARQQALRKKLEK